MILIIIWICRPSGPRSCGYPDRFAWPLVKRRFSIGFSPATGRAVRRACHLNELRAYGNTFSRMGSQTAFQTRVSPDCNGTASLPLDAIALFIYDVR